MSGIRSRVALVGIGSNSVRLLVAQGSEVVERAEMVTRLASYETAPGGEKLLTAQAISDTRAAATHLARRSKAMNASLIGVLATEAVRRAANREELITPMERELGLTVQVISGEEEALLGWLAVASNYAAAGSILGVIDIGGGSTDISIGSPGAAHAEAMRSVKLGSRTAAQRFGLDLPVTGASLATIQGTLDEELKPQVRFPLTPGLGVVIGGTADVLASVSSYATGELYGTQDALIEKAWLQEWLEQMAGMDIQERAAEGVPEDRADVIVAGGVILLSILDAWGLDEFYTSRRNILDGLLAR